MYEDSMSIKKLFLLSILMISHGVYASDDREKMYLTQVLNQLSAIKPLLVSAAREQSSINRVKFHYTKFKSSNGKISNGVIDDINEIEKGIREKLNHAPHSPHVFKPIKGDYIPSFHTEPK